MSVTKDELDRIRRDAFEEACDVLGATGLISRRLADDLCDLIRCRIAPHLLPARPISDPQPGPTAFGQLIGCRDCRAVLRGSPLCETHGDRLWEQFKIEWQEAVHQRS